MKRINLFMPCMLACVMMALFAYPANSAYAKELEVSATENPYFSASFQTADKPIKFKSHDKSLLQGDTYVVTLQNITDDMHVTFRSSDTDVLTVKKLSDSTCRVTGVGYGTAKVIARVTTSSGFFLFDETETINTKFQVSPKAASVRFRVNQKKIALQSSVKLVMTIRPSISKEVPVFQSQNNKIASISSKGVVTGKKLGTTYVTATIENGKSAKCKIMVKTAAALNGKTKK